MHSHGSLTTGGTCNCPGNQYKPDARDATSQDDQCALASFQELYQPESTYLGKAPIAQLTRIDAGHRLFSVPLTRITSVPECAVPSVGFVWGPAAVSRACGVSVGLEEALTRQWRT
jgi:hypothetical protein